MGLGALFYSTFEKQLDAKRRIVVPQEFRAAASGPFDGVICFPSVEADCIEGGGQARLDTYLGVIIPLSVFSLILPNYTLTTAGPTLSARQEVFVALVCLGLYAVFLAVQTVRHRAYFEAGDGDGDLDFVVAGKSGLFLFENKTK